MDQSSLDRKYFIDDDTYNCPFCNRHSVVYSNYDSFSFWWNENKLAHGYIVKCEGCGGRSMHLSYYNFHNGFKHYYTGKKDQVGNSIIADTEVNKLDSYFFYHHPTSFFTIDGNIPEEIRDLVSEAEGCRKMNFMVGASGALRKAIYEFLKHENIEGNEYKDRIMSLKKKFPKIDPEYFDSISHIQGLTSEELHEQEGSFEPWNREDFDYFIEAMKAVLDEVYVRPHKKASVWNKIEELRGKSTLSKRDSKLPTQKASS